MLRWRLLLGTTFITALVGLVWLDFATSPPGAWLFALVVVVAMAAAHEVVTLLASGGYHPHPGVIYGGTLLVIASNAVPLFWLDTAAESPLARLGWPLVAFTISFLAALVVETHRYDRPGRSMVQVGLATFGVAYVGLLLSFAMQLRVLGGPTEGLIGVVALIMVVKFGDTGAYAVGRLIGRHKMAPLVSPGKTLEGAAGALAFGCLGAWLSFTLMPRWTSSALSQPAWGWIVFGLAVAIAGLLGDLAESLLKRDVGAKDSSNWLLGFGGVLDLVDSILFAAPVAYLCWLLLSKS